MNCKNCNFSITDYQNKEYNGCCCDVCDSLSNKFKPAYCANCGLPLTEEDIKHFGSFCSGGCCQEMIERELK